VDEKVEEDSAENQEDEADDEERAWRRKRGDLKEKRDCGGAAAEKERCNCGFGGLRRRTRTKEGCRLQWRETTAAAFPLPIPPQFPFPLA
jgi:hypothetical protein